MIAPVRLHGGPVRPRCRRRMDERGSAQVELVVLAVVSFLFVAMIVFAGRLNVGSAHAEAAARSAARTISVARNPESAVGDARSAAEQTVEVGSAMCRSMGFDYGITPDEVTVTIDCEVDLSEATLLEVPGSMNVSATASEVIDQYREADDGTGAVAP